MPIITRCEHCGKLLRVADEHAGKQARCPGCSALYTVPHRSDPLAQQLQEPPAEQTPAGNESQPGETWFVRTAEGRLYGPADWTQLQQWAADGRIPSTAWVRRMHGDWQAAAEVLGPRLPGDGAPAQQLASAAPPGGSNPYQSPGSATTGYQVHGGQSRIYADHNGILALVLACVGFFCCPLLSIAALVLSTLDLSRLNKGEVDPSGLGILRAAQVISIIQLAITVLWFTFNVLMVVAGN